MMSSPSRLSDDRDVLVIDASVIINLLGTGRTADLLRVLNRTIVIDELALAEVTKDPFTKLPGRDAIEPLIVDGLVSSSRLSAAAFEAFLNLTGATPPDDQGDGEAATLAQSFDIGGAPVIDERKATRIALAMRQGHPVFNTIDILGCPRVITAFSRQEHADMIYSALVYARMRVPPSCRDWVCDLIGTERASGCPSLGFARGLKERG